MSMKKELFGTALRGYLREKAGWLGGFLGFVVCFALLGWLCGLPPYFRYAALTGRGYPFAKNAK